MTLLAYLSLMQPAWALGLLAAVAVPLAAHLLSRHRGRMALFPAARFVARAAADLARVQRPRHLALLLLRTLMLTLVVLAFCRPLWVHRPTYAAVAEAHIAILLDRSASMARVERGVSLLEEAKRQARSALSTLHGGRALATVVLIDAEPAPLLPEMSANLPLLDDLVRQVTVSHERGDLAAALAAAVAQARPATANAAPVPLVVHLFSDLQASQWPGEAWQRDLAAEQVTLHVHRVGRDSANAWVRQARVWPREPVLGQVAQLAVEVGHSDLQDRDVVVRFEVGQSVTRLPVRLPPRSTVTVHANLPTQAAGFHQATVRLEGGDALSLDDHAAVGFTVAPGRTVRLISAATDHEQSAAYYVRRALQPGSSGRIGSDGDRLQVQSMTPQQWLAAPANPAAGCVLIEAGALSPAMQQRLAEHLDGGGAAVWFIDSAAAADSLGEFGRAVERWSVLTPQRWRMSEPMAVRAVASHRLLEAFEGPARAALLETPVLHHLQANLNDAATALLTLQDGSPLLAVRPGESGGGFAVWAGDIRPGASDLVKGPVFLPLLHELVHGLSPQPPAMPTAHPGQRPSAPLPGAWRATDLLVRGPSGDEVSIHGLIDTRRGTELQLDRLREVGFHTILQRRDGQTLAGFTAELDPAESDPTAAVIDLGAAGDNSGPHDEARDLRLGEVTVELWPWCLVAAALLLVSEAAVVGWLHREQTKISSTRLEADELAMER